MAVTSDGVECADTLSVPTARFADRGVEFDGMDGVHDMGGMHGFGPVVTPHGDLSHHEPWELRAQVLGLLSGSARRGSIEGLDPATYLSSSYYVRWLLAAETTLVRRGQLGSDELARWRATIEADPEVELPVRSAP